MSREGMRDCRNVEYYACYLSKYISNILLYLLTISRISIRLKDSLMSNIQLWSFTSGSRSLTSVRNDNFEERGKKKTKHIIDIPLAIRSSLQLQTLEQIRKQIMCYNHNPAILQKILRLLIRTYVNTLLLIMTR